MRSPDGEDFTGNELGGRLDFLHRDLAAVGEDFVDDAVLRLQHALARRENVCPRRREGRAGDGGELAFELLDVLV